MLNLPQYNLFDCRYNFIDYSNISYIYQEYVYMFLRDFAFRCEKE